MKITVIIPTGETRSAQEGEYYQNGGWRYCYSWTDNLYPVGIAHEVEIPDGASSVYVGPVLYGNEIGTKTFPLPLPKKIKKWQWVYRKKDSTRYSLTIHHYASEDEARKNISPNLTDCWKLDQTEIEVEE